MSILIMTGTIKPQLGARELRRTNVADRIDDYRRSLSHHLSLLRSDLINGLVFVENSGYGVEPFADLLNDAMISDRLEVISYPAVRIENQTRFAGECGLLHHAFLNSVLLSQQSEGYVWKITGRYVIQNLIDIMRKSETGEDLIIHCRDYPIRFVDFGLVGFRRKKASQVVERFMEWPNIDNQSEQAVRDMMDQGYLDRFKVRPRFSHIPDFRGIRGVDEASYGDPRYRLKYLARFAVHRLVPSLWL